MFELLCIFSREQKLLEDVEEILNAPSEEFDDETLDSDELIEKLFINRNRVLQFGKDPADVRAWHRFDARANLQLIVIKNFVPVRSFCN